MTREELRKSGERAKREIKALADRLDEKGRLQLKLALMAGEASETVARLLMKGEYDKSPRQDFVELMDEVVAKFRKAKAS